MAKIKITCDSTCDLTQKMYEQYSIDVIPLGIILGEELRHDGIDVDVSELYDYVSKTGILPKTSAISQYEYTEHWKKYLNEGYEIIHINISSELSACHQNAKLAAKELKGVYAIDSRLLSTGMGILVLAAAKYQESGLSALETVDKLNELKTRVDCSFVLQTLEYLQKGGRCSAVLSFGANILKIHPEINMENGTMDVGHKYRGSAEKSILDYVRGRISTVGDFDKSVLFVVHSHVDQEIVEKAKQIASEAGFENVIETRAGCTISSHCGPGTLGLMMVRKN